MNPLEKGGGYTGSVDPEQGRTQEAVNREGNRHYRLRVKRERPATSSCRLRDEVSGRVCDHLCSIEQLIDKEILVVGMGYQEPAGPITDCRDTFEPKVSTITAACDENRSNIHTHDFSHVLLQYCVDSLAWSRIVWVGFQQELAPNIPETFFSE